MSEGGRGRATLAKVGLLAVLAAAVAGLGLLVLGGRSGPPRTPPPRRRPRRTSKPAAPAAPAAPVGSASSAGADERDLSASVDRFLSHIKVQPARPAAGPPAPASPARLLDRARKGALRLVDFRIQLEDAIRAGGGPEAARLLVRDGAGLDPKLRFQLALALANRPDPAAARILLQGLKDGDPRVRPMLVFALRGSDAPETVETFVDLYATDQDKKVREQAAFAVGERGARVPPLLRERAHQTARDDLKSDDPDLVKAAADVLGAPPLSDADRQLLIETLRSDPDPGRRLQALRALASAKVSPEELAPVLEQVAADPSAGATLRAMAQHVLAAIGKGGASGGN